MPEPPPTWLLGLEPQVDRRRDDRRNHDRRRRVLGAARVSERRSGTERRVRQRRESVPEHLRNALQVLLHLSLNQNLPLDVREDLAAVGRRIWLALQELERTLGRRAAS